MPLPSPDAERPRSESADHSSLPNAPETDLTPLWPPDDPPLPDAQRSQTAARSRHKSQSDRVAIEFELFHQRLNREAAQVHERLRLGQNHVSARNARGGSQRPAAAIAHHRPVCSASRSIARKPALCGVNWYSIPGFPRPTTRNGPRSLRFHHSRLRAGHFFPPFSAAAASGVSCLPFLATSGSAGAAAQQPRPTAGATSSLITTT